MRRKNSLIIPAVLAFSLCTVTAVPVLAEDAAQTEAVCAGALQVQLAGEAWYFGKKHEKDTIGDPIREIEPRDILRSEKLMIGTEELTFLLFGGIRLYFIREF